MSHLDRLIAQALADAAERKKRPLPEDAPAQRKVPSKGLIAEVKRASPSKGAINPGLDPAALAKAYERGGAALISVLTERQSFGGSLEDLRAARAAVQLPVLRKDFLVEEFQIRESRAHGADAILLIAAAAEGARLSELRCLAGELGLAVLFEIHEESELEKAALCQPDLLGINARDLRTLEVRPETFEKLAPRARQLGIPLVAESGVKTAADAKRYRERGASMILVGEALSSAKDPEAAARELAK